MYERKFSGIQLPLQFFAEPPTDGSDDRSEGAGSAAGGENGGSSEPTFDDILKNNRNYQSEFDRRLSKALETAKEKWETEKQAELEEAEKLRKLNADQKARYEQEKTEKKLAEREAAITKRELTATAKEILAEKGLPAELSGILNLTSAETCTESIETVGKAFNLAVEKKVNEQLRGTPPKRGGESKTGDPFIDGFGL